MQRVRNCAIPFFFLLLTLLVGCGRGKEKESIRVGMDPRWYALVADGRENNITAFSSELLQQIGELEHISFIRVSVSWDNLLLGLRKEEYNAILSPLMPYNFNQQNFDFSDLYLPLGPVLVVPVNSSLTSFSAVNGKEIAVLSGSAAEVLVEQQKGVLIRTYDSIPKALNDLAEGKIDGAVIDLLFASAYCKDLYQGRLKIVSLPLNDEGLRLITLHGSNKELIQKFNRGLAELKSSDAYQKLLDKWGLPS